MLHLTIWSLDRGQLMANGTLMPPCVMKKLMYCYQSPKVFQNVNKIQKSVSALYNCCFTQKTMLSCTNIVLKFKKEELCSAGISPRCQHWLAHKTRGFILSQTGNSLHNPGNKQEKIAVQFDWCRERLLSLQSTTVRCIDHQRAPSSDGESTDLSKAQTWKATSDSS